MAARPRILFLCDHCPTARSTGVRLRTVHVGKLLQRVGDVTMVVASHLRWTKEEIDADGRMFELRRVVRLRETPLSGFRERVRYELDSGFLNTNRAGTTPEDAAAVRALIEQHDMAWVQSLMTANAFRVWVWPR